MFLYCFSAQNDVLLTLIHSCDNQKAVKNNFPTLVGKNNATFHCDNVHVLKIQIFSTCTNIFLKIEFYFQVWFLSNPLHVIECDNCLFFVKKMFWVKIFSI